jgi:hypothetical protein
MKHFVTFFACLCATGSITAQQVDWLQSAPVGWEMNPGMPLHTVASAPGYLVAMRSAEVGLGGIPGVFGTLALEQLDPLTGASLWTCMLGSSVYLSAAVVDTNGVAYFAGQFKEEQLEICDGSVLTYVGNAIDENGFLIAWDLVADELLWAKNLTAEVGGWHRVSALAIDPNGEVWYAMTDFFEGMISRVDADGITQETRVIDHCKTIGSISFDPWGGMYVSGGADDVGFSFAGVIPVIGFDYAMFVLRYRPDGSAGFAAFADDVTFQRPNVVATNDGHAYLAGSFFSQSDWGGFPVNGAGWGTASFITKLDSNGVFQWLVESDPPGGTINGDVEPARSTCIAVDESNNVYFTGTLRGEVGWGNGVTSDGQTIGTRTLTVVAFDPAGIALWARTSEPGTSVWAQAITASAEPGAIHYAGHITSEFVMAGHTTNTGGDQAAMFGRISELSTGVEAVAGIASSLMAWPNPVAEVLFVEVENPIPADLFNSAGQRVQNMLLQPGRNAVSMATHAPGLYLLRLADGSAVRVVKD